ncbi:mannosyltransferase MptB [Gordonia hirsuta DSM 44140 = NBRC 16056]|uniref:Mannosyltransferase MptB n=1 Tax=Gordonia hirsuta DSM 44140 = NBRC 16056 TaxID=1121927 RepID=L7L8M2_9ACTN|nr:polyprenol phosphomannose-dependent alpha 1,6 mannosyltransferase MptB [Gordonia hirsuta]GAC57284.1 mannosyltransferase MptB [Gordonia hirsuta DSM 44140 = NBRC 16056]
MPNVPGVRAALDHLGLSRPSRSADIDATGDYGVMLARLHGEETREVGPLNPLERLRMRRIRLFGTTGAVLVLIGSLGTGMMPVLQNPVTGMRVLSLPARMFSTALTISIAGTMMLVVAWVLIGRYAIGRYSVEVAENRSPARRMSRAQADRTLLMWILPLLFAPPLLSKDVYSYLAQSAIAFRGMDPYTYSPMRGLGVDHPLALSVPNLWKDTPAPYGPLFLWIGEQITRVTGENIPVAIGLHRLVALAGVAMIIWALPRLARRCGVSSVAALWLGAMNPLLILHLVGGIHNEALMIGMMLVGVEWCFRAIYGLNSLWDGLLPTKAGWLLVAGVAMIAASSMIKVASLLALGFVGIALSRRWGATLPALRNAPLRQWWARSRATVFALTRSALLTGTVMVAVVVAICLGTGLGFGWTSTLSTGGIVRSWMSMPTLLGVVAGRIGLWLGLGEQTDAILEIARPIGQLIAGLFVVRWLLACLSGRIHPLGGLGIAMATFVLFFPFVQAWYLLWAIIPLAAWATTRWFRVGTVIVSGIIAVVVMPTSSDTPPMVVAQGLATGLVVTLITSVFFFLDHPTRRWLRSRRRA